MKLSKEKRQKITCEIGDIIEEKCRRCYYNRTNDENFSTGICMQCPTGEELRRLGRYFDTEPKKTGGVKRMIPAGLTAERVRELNMQGIADKRISIMYDRSSNYVSKLKKKWKEQGVWEGPTNIWKIKKGGEKA